MLKHMFLGVVRHLDDQHRNGAHLVVRQVHFFNIEGQSCYILINNREDGIVEDGPRLPPKQLWIAQSTMHLCRSGKALRGLIQKFSGLGGRASPGDLECPYDGLQGIRYTVLNFLK